MPRRPRQELVRLPAGFAGRLRAARQARDWSYADVAAALGVHPTAARSLETGQTFWITRARFDILATALEVEPAWLLTRPLGHI